VTFPLRLAEKLSDKILTASKESFRLESEKVIVTNHGIDTKEFSPRDQGSREQNSITICSIGRISPRKDYETLINAANILVHEKKLSNIRFVVIGKEGTSDQKQYVQTITGMVEGYKLEPYFKFLGSIPHHKVAECHQRNDLFVNMRQTGGMDKAVLEAMACEVPTVICNTTFKPLLGPWVEQLLFEERNARDLAERLDGLIRLAPEERNTIGQHLRSVVIQEHDLGKLMDRIVSILRSL
jgi:glycosyltransferase involved in cell wall biosynthesis